MEREAGGGLGYCLPGRLVAYRVRSLLDEALGGCRGAACGICAACRIFGRFPELPESGALAVGAFHSEQLAEAAPEAWRGRAGEGGALRGEEIAPSGTTFWGVLTLDSPDLETLSTVFAAFPLAGELGLGAGRIGYGRMQIEVQVIHDGYLPLGLACDGAPNGAEVSRDVMADLRGREWTGDVLLGAAAADAAERLARRSPLHPAFGEDL
jgi:hypothetical protein